MLTMALFVDGANMFYAQRKLGWHIDYRRLYDLLAQDYKVYNAYYYTSVPTPVDASLEGFLRALTAMGYTVRRKALKEIVDQETGQTFRKANLDIELVIDMFNTADLYEVAILATGDGDFERAVELLRSRGKRVFAVGSREMAAYDLINAVDKYIFLEDLREQVGKQSSSTLSQVLPGTQAAGTSPIQSLPTAPGSLQAPVVNTERELPRPSIPDLDRPLPAVD